MRAPLEVIVSIARAVERAGDLHDVRDLVDRWERVTCDNQPRADRMRYEARHVPCCCEDSPEQRDGRCQRCHGLLDNEH